MRVDARRRGLTMRAQFPLDALSWRVIVDGGGCEDGQPDEQGRVGAARAGHSDEGEHETCRRARREGHRPEQGERTQRAASAAKGRSGADALDSSRGDSRLTFARAAETSRRVYNRSVLYESGERENAMGEFGDIEKKASTGGGPASAVPEVASSPQTCACENPMRSGHAKTTRFFARSRSICARPTRRSDALARSTYEELLRIDAEAAADKIALSEELSVNLETYADAMETYADFAAMNRVIDGHNTARASRAARLSDLCACS